jgi:peptidoglycan hydrolase-like protein with peptidoglycan-binding domain
MTDTLLTTETPLTHRPRRRRRRGRTILLSVVVLAVAGAATTTMLVDLRRSPVAASNDLPPGSTTVTKRNLVDTRTFDGTLGYGPTTAVVNRSAGTITALPIQGQILHRGEVMYRVDNTPVILLFGSLPAYRALGPGDQGPDVKQLEHNLRALGYSGFTVDETFTSQTATAVRAWQDDLGLTKTGRVDLGRVVFADQDLRVDSVDIGLGAPASPGLTVLHVSGTARVVTVQLETAAQKLATVNTPVSVILPGGQRVAGTIAKAYTVIDQGSGPNPQATTQIEVVVALADAKAAEGLDAASVDVLFTQSERTSVLTVPVAALVVLREGGYGVEVIEGSSSRYVAVDTGLFASGYVEITGDGIVEGTKVGMAK